MKRTPSLTFRRNGSVYSVTRIDNERGIVHASRTRNGRRTRGRPAHFKLDTLPKLTVRNVG